MIEKLCPQAVKLMDNNRDSIAERRTAKLATKGRNVNLSPQKIQLPIKDDISEGDDSGAENSSDMAIRGGVATPDIVHSSETAPVQPHLPRLNSCQITKTGFFSGAGSA